MSYYRCSSVPLRKREKKPYAECLHFIAPRCCLLPSLFATHERSNNVYFRFSTKNHTLLRTVLLIYALDRYFLCMLQINIKCTKCQNCTSGWQNYANRHRSVQFLVERVTMSVPFCMLGNTERDDIDFDRLPDTPKLITTN